MINPIFFSDHTAIKDMIEGKRSGAELRNKINELTYKGADVKVITSMSCFLRALYLADSKLSIRTIQKTLNFLKIIPSFSDFRDEKAVMNEFIMIVKINTGNYGRK